MTVDVTSAMFYQLGCEAIHVGSWSIWGFYLKAQGIHLGLGRHFSILLFPYGLAFKPSNSIEYLTLNEAIRANLLGGHFGIRCIRS